MNITLFPKIRIFITLLLTISFSNVIALPDPFEEGNCQYQKFGPSLQSINNTSYPMLAYVPIGHTDNWAIPVNMPLVILMHGNGFSMSNQESRYEAIIKLLASHCLAVAAPDWPSGSAYEANTNLGRDTISTTIDNIYASGWASRLGRDVILLGHSNGGSAVWRFADTPNHYWKNGGFLEVKSVITMAPSVKSPEINIIKTMEGITKSFMVMQVSNDTDSKCINAHCGFIYYDRASSKLNQTESVENGFPNRVQWFWKQRTSAGNQGHKIFVSQTGRLPAGYINAYLQWNVYNKSNFRRYFSEQLAPDNLLDFMTDDDQEVNITYSDNHKRIVANFENNYTNNRFYGGSLSRVGKILSTSNVAIKKVRNAYGNNNDKYSANKTRVLDVRWNETSSSSYIRFRYYGSRRLDIRNYESITFRAGQRQQNHRVEEGEPAQIKVRLRSRQNNGDYSFSNKVTRYVPWPVSSPIAIKEPGGVEAFDLRINEMSSITVRLDDFDFDSDFDKTKLEEIRIYLPYEGAIAIDDIEFTDKYIPPVF